MISPTLSVFDNVKLLCDSCSNNSKYNSETKFIIKFNFFSLCYVDQINNFNNGRQISATNLTLLNSIDNFDFFDLNSITSLHYGQNRSERIKSNNEIQNCKKQKNKKYIFSQLEYLWLDACDIYNKKVNNILNNITLYYQLY